MQGISITSQTARIEIRTQRAQINIENPRPRMRIRTRKAAMRIERRPPQFRMTRDNQRMELGNRTQQRLARDLKNFTSKQHTASDADGTGLDKSTGLDAIADIVQERARPLQPDSKSTLVSLPRIEWDMGYNNIVWDSHEMVIDWDMTGQGLRISVNPHTVEIKLSRYPLVRITYNAEYFEMRSKKKKLDTKI